MLFLRAQQNKSAPQRPWAPGLCTSLQDFELYSCYIDCSLGGTGEILRKRALIDTIAYSHVERGRLLIGTSVRNIKSRLVFDSVESGGVVKRLCYNNIESFLGLSHWEGLIRVGQTL